MPETGLVGLLLLTSKTIEEQAEQHTCLPAVLLTSRLSASLSHEVFPKTVRCLYNSVLKDVEEFMPIVYDPTTHLTLSSTSQRYVDSQYACFLSADHLEGP